MSRSFTFIFIVLISVLAFCEPCGAVTAVLGDKVALRGAAPGADYVYLFLTGPNLPANGVRLDDVSRTVVSGNPSSFVQVDVANDVWQYNWYTGKAGGKLDAGAYTVFAVLRPKGRLDLAGTDFTTRSVDLTRPAVEVTATGTLRVLSEPAGGAITVDGISEGTTPVELTAVPEGIHTVEITLPGYRPAIQTTQVVAGTVATVDLVLMTEAIPAATAISTLLETTSQPTTSASVPAPLPAAAAMIGLSSAIAIHGFRRR
jgi:hypothetical protein